MEYSITKPIRLIELFAGVGTQSMAMRDLGANYESYKISEWEVNANASYYYIFNDFDKTDYSRDMAFEEVVDALGKIGISTDGKNALNCDKIKRKGEKWARKVYNQFKSNNNLGSIMNIKGSDLEIVDKDKYEYIMTYSYPCTDISFAGKQAGMKKGSGTRSGLLWEVERILNELENKPQILIMENVPAVHSKKFMPDFQGWIDCLSEMGYTNHWQDLNAKDYGVAQNRNRTFMISFLGDYDFKFPEPIPLTKKMKDYLEEDVDEHYYVSDETADRLIGNLLKSGKLDNLDIEESVGGGGYKQMQGRE